MMFRLDPSQLVSTMVVEHDCELNLDIKDEMLESMNEKADTMRKRIVDILGEDIGKLDNCISWRGNYVALKSDPLNYSDPLKSECFQTKNMC